MTIIVESKDRFINSGTLIYMDANFDNGCASVKRVAYCLSNYLARLCEIITDF